MDLLDAMASFAYQYRECYDAIVLSGDLATTARKPDLDKVRHLIETVPAEGYWDEDGHPSLRAAGKRVLIVPGNHDRFGPLRGLRPYPPGDETFDGVLSWKRHIGSDQFPTMGLSI
jgi:3',5'-cyclic AMP phosphodiesterase CpdA